MNKLKKHIFVILLIAGMSYTAVAQNDRMRLRDNSISRPGFRPPGSNNNNNTRGNRMPNVSGLKKVQVVKEAFLNRRLSLTTEESDRFWPLYRQYQQEVLNVRRLKRLNNSDAQANGREQVRKDLEYESQLVDIKKHYNDEFLKALPAEKVSQLYKSEREFMDEMLKQLHEHPE